MTCLCANANDAFKLYTDVRISTVKLKHVPYIYWRESLNKYSYKNIKYINIYETIAIYMCVAVKIIMDII